MIYEQKTGRFTSDTGSLFDIGYSGNGAGKNNPEMQHVKNVGVIPKGSYTIGLPYDSPKTGPFTLALTPFKSNEMFGRDAFQIHGDDRMNPGNASHGCIILPRKIREQINNCTDKKLYVV